MKKIAIIFILLFGSVNFCMAQKIESKKVFGGYQCSQEGKLINMKQMSKMMANQAEAHDYMSRARTGYSAATIISGIGGAFVGFPVGIALSGGEPAWGLLGVGVGIIAVSIPIASKANKNALKAIDIYNNSLNSSSQNRYKPQLRLVGDRNGIGLALRF